MKFGFDIHGTIDAKPKFFAILSKRLVEAGHSVYIITGSMKTEKIELQLKEIGINYTHFFSVADYLIAKGVQHHFSDSDNPWFPIDEWNKAKADFCQSEGIDIHFDDSKTYGKFFQTLYVLIPKFS